MRYYSLTARGRLLIFTLCFLGLLAGFHYRKYRPPYEFYRALVRAELAASRKLVDEARRDSGQRYVKFRQLQGAGVNNQAQEILLYHHLALSTGRIYVYQPFVWNHRHENLPLSGFLLGPTQGSLSSTLWDEVCPPDGVKNVTIDVPQEEVWNTAREALDGPEKCVYVENWLLKWSFLDSPALHDIWPNYRKYLRSNFEWPPHITGMVRRAHTDLNLRSRSAVTDDGEPYLALHFRRGDFEDHCQYLAQNNKSFTSWSTLPVLQSASMFAPPLDPLNHSSVLEHCYPSLDRILAAIDVQVCNRPHIRSIYVLHDAAWDHLSVYAQYYRMQIALKSSQRALSAGWKGDTNGMRSVTHSGMIPVKPGERDWKVAVDVEFARQAEVFIGNGYSSLTSQIVALRLADGGRPEDITLL